MIKRVGVIIGLAATIAAQAPPQEEVKLTSAQNEGIAAIKELGGSFQVDGFAHLEGLPGLQTRYLYRTQITDVGATKLNTVLPECQISR